MWLKCILRGIVFPPTLGGTVWERRVPPDVNKWSNCIEELLSLFPPYIRYNSVVGRTVDDTRKSPIITLYEPSVRLFIYYIQHHPDPSYMEYTTYHSAHLL